MVLDGFDSVKAEKALAVRNFSRRRRFKWMFAFCIFMFLVSWFAVAGQSLRLIFQQLVVLLNSDVCVFMFLNAMIFAVYSLSGLEKRTRRNEDEFPKDSEPSHGIAADGEVGERLEAPADDCVVEKRIVPDSNAVSPVDKVAITTFSEAEGPISPILHSNSLAEVIPQTKRYQRTESERYEHRETNKLRRSKTDIHQELVVTSGGEPPRLSLSVNEMDIDDFNRTIETFIAEKKLLQRKEYREEQKTILALDWPDNRTAI